MLQIKGVSKEYVTGELRQVALDNVSLNLRDNEFVAVLGPSGSGKTTLLNIIGGLDRYDGGDLIINGISTKKYKDRDWDSYRNHTVGFVFQSYNLIPHQSILSNVELSLTISGISPRERRERAKEALAKVGLADQIHKRPNQMSGGQMQRVAIARALVNNPDVLLADEPTGALDTDTGVQVMNLLKEVARDRLVVMVTHNPELAETYATRIVRLKDGRITDDSNPFEESEAEGEAPRHETMGRASMSFFTALSLSFNNLRTKKGRTLLTAFAGSIGIIGIALILSLSNGVNTYIEDLQKDTMTSYPITIEERSMDLSSLIETAQENAGAPRPEEMGHELDAVYSDGSALEMASTIMSSITENNLTDFKAYLDDETSEIHDYIGENGIVYTYDTDFSVYTYDPTGELVNTDGVTIEKENSASSFVVDRTSLVSSIGSGSATIETMGGASGNFSEMMPGADGELISGVVTDSYDLLYGSWPDSYDEVVLVLNSRNEISTTVLYELGLLPASEYEELMDKIDNGEEVTVEKESFEYGDICEKELYLLSACDNYVENGDGTFSFKGGSAEEIEDLIGGALKLKITGVIRPAEDASNADIQGAIGYTQALTDYIITHTNESAVVKAQTADETINVLNGLTFEPEDDEQKAEDARIYLNSLSDSDKADMFKGILISIYGQDSERTQGMLQMSDSELSAVFDQYVTNDERSEDTLLSIYDAYISTGSYDDNLEAFGVVSYDAPSSISIYVDSFEDKEHITDCIDAYNDGASEQDQITYTDYVGLLMSSVTTIVNVVSYVLIAFVAVSLIVSSIMIGIITYISVLERTKEIGILRAIGASKGNVAQVFNAETFIIGLCAGIIGIGISLLILIPGNAVIHALTGTTDVSASLPAAGAAILIALSVVLTLIGGLIPSRKAAKRDPVAALRTE